VFAEALSQSTFGGFIITVLVHTDMASPHLHHAGSAAQKDKYLRDVTAGEADHRGRRSPSRARARTSPASARPAKSATATNGC
jgi:alkylation response protein AidB-like acyl-CoA dehydrogenase